MIMIVGKESKTGINFIRDERTEDIAEIKLITLNAFKRILGRELLKNIQPGAEGRHQKQLIVHCRINLVFEISGVLCMNFSTNTIVKMPECIVIALGLASRVLVL